MKKLIIFFFFCGILIFGNTSYAEESLISKQDACKYPDGIFPQGISIQNYPGYKIRVKSFFKDKNDLFYIVDATGLAGETREAFLWSWDCAKKKVKQLSKYNFASYPSNEHTLYNESWIDTYNPIEIVYGDKDHIFIKQKRIFKGATPPDRYLVFYRGNKQVNENFILEKLRGFSDFRKSVLDKSVKIYCSPLISKACMEDTFIENYTPKKSDYRFYLEGIQRGADNRVILSARYGPIDGIPSYCNSDDCQSYYFDLFLDLRTGTVKYDPNYYTMKQVTSGR